MSADSVASSHASTVLRNSSSRALETAFSVAMALATSVAVARYIGPQKLGSYTYLVWLTSSAGIVASLGLPGATQKYMAEFLAGGQSALARSVFESTLRLQAWVSGVASVIGVVLAITLSNEPLVAAVVVLSLFPRTLGCIPSMANMAAENMMANVPGALMGGFTQLLVILATLLFDWGLLGIALAMNVGYWVELAVKMRSASRNVPAGASVPLPRDVKRRLVTFSGQGLALLLLNLVVWDRSDIVFLKALSGDIRQVTFFSVAFNIVDKLLTLPSMLAAGVGATVMAQFGRDQRRVGPMVSTAMKYILLGSTPLFVAVACLSGLIVRVLYGPEYAAVTPVLAIVALFAISKALMPVVENLLQAFERQAVLVWVGCGCAALNILLDVVLVPARGALGAAVANAAAQTAALVGVCLYASARMQVKLSWTAGRIAAAGVAMGAVAAGAALMLPSTAGRVAAVVLALLVFAAIARWTGVVGREDAARLRQMRDAMAVGLRARTERLLRFVS